MWVLNGISTKLLLKTAGINWYLFSKRSANWIYLRKFTQMFSFVVVYSNIKTQPDNVYASWTQLSTTHHNADSHYLSLFIIYNYNKLNRWKIGYSTSWTDVELKLVQGSIQFGRSEIPKWEIAPRAQNEIQ